MGFGAAEYVFTWKWYGLIFSDQLLMQVENFINAHLAANPQDGQSADANEISTIASQKQPGQTTKPAAAKYQFVASKNSKVFHLPGCPSVGRITPENLEGFADRAEAVGAGKRPCKRCKP